MPTLVSELAARWPSTRAASWRTFRQHTSWALDPQLHTHLVIANRVLRPDGRQPAQAWDITVGQLDQHQATFSITRGLGPARMPRFGIGFLHSRKLTEQATQKITRTVEQERNLEQAITGPRLMGGR